MGMIRQRKSERVEMSKSERVVEIRVNGAPLAVLKTDCAVAADYIQFLEALTRALMVPEALEREANASGKTILHPGFAAFGSAPLTDSTDP
ncbi:hypothetical protein M2354_002045 [Leclercia adecarboxylata]|uniref:hypothetical protein n=1 Tax=Leclercia adecarboxylata TaxID=83655 RepID=UPI002472EEA6|nr:hypothetical protein [Leclercia adecarboxylata]MDH6162390.1 hypothetical protein [Leclercia adecarboxylata]